MNRTNLKLLADWLIENAGRLVETKAFDMQCYRGSYDGFNELSGESFSSPTSCGTVGCAIGWAPASKILELAPVDSDYGYLGQPLKFHTYTSRVMDLSVEDTAWTYLFDEEWSGVDNTPKGAAIRILYLLSEGVPYNFDGVSSDFHEETVKEYMEWYYDKT